MFLLAFTSGGIIFHKFLELHSTISEKKISVTNFSILMQRQIQGGGHGGTHFPPIFCNHLCFCNYLEELETVLFEGELIINNAPLTYTYPNTIETCLTPNHLLFGRQLLYSSNINCS